MSARVGPRYRPRPFPTPRRDLSLTPVPLLVACVAAAAGGDDVRVGVGGFVRPGAWAPLTADGGIDAAAVTDGDGLTVTRRFEGDPAEVLIQAGREESPVVVTLGGVTRTLRPGVDFTPLGPQDRLWATVDLPAASVLGAGDGDGGGPTSGDPVRVAAFDRLGDLPAVAGGLATVRAVVAETGGGPGGAGAERLERWVTGGGHLVLSLNADGGGLPGFVPLEALPARPLASYSALEELASRGSGLGGSAALNRLVPAVVRPLDPAGVDAADGRVLARGDGGVLVAEVPVGFGRVTVCAASLHAAPLRTWAGLPGFLKEISRRGPARAAAGAAGGRGELAGQAFAAAEPAAAGGAPWSPGGVELLVLGAALLLGPVDWFLCHRVLRRPAATWATLPVWLAVVAGGAVWAGDRAAPAPTRLELADFDAAAGRVRGAAWATVPAPAGGRADVAFRPAATLRADVTARLGFAADPSSGFGGLFRGGATGAVAAGYAIDGTTARGVPLPEGSAVRLRLDWEGTAAVPPVVSSLATVGGRLTGAVSHALPGALSDLLLVHGGRVYRPDPAKRSGGGLPPRRPFAPDGPGVERRDLGGFLTQRRRTVSRGGGADDEEPERVTVSRYDAASRDFGLILPVLSFFERAGGTGYTGLTNAELEPLDLSALAATDRAVLLGRLDAPLTELAVDFGDEPVPVGTAVTYVRVVVPVPERAAADAALPVGPVRPAAPGPDADTDAEPADP